MVLYILWEGVGRATGVAINLSPWVSRVMFWSSWVMGQCIGGIFRIPSHGLLFSFCEWNANCIRLFFFGSIPMRVLWAVRVAVRARWVGNRQESLGDPRHLVPRARPFRASTSSVILLRLHSTSTRARPRSVRMDFSPRKSSDPDRRPFPRAKRSRGDDRSGVVFFFLSASL